MKIQDQPEFSVVTRWKNARPQYTVGHVERVQYVRKQMDEQLPGVFIAGSSYNGVGIPDCIHQGEIALDEMLHYRSEEHTSELQSRFDLVCRLLLEKK